MVLIVRPGSTFGTAVYVLLTALLFTTTRDLTTRGLQPRHPVHLRRCRQRCRHHAGGVLVVPFDSAWVVPSAWAWGVMTSSAACLFVANTFMIMALRTGEIAVVAPFRYAPVPFALLLGYLWWDDFPDAVA